MGIIDKEIYVMGGDLGGLLLRMHWYYIDIEILADFFILDFGWFWGFEGGFSENYLSLNGFGVG